MKITALIPVGPQPSHVKWLDDCVASVFEQTESVGEVLLMDDGAGLGHKAPKGCRVWESPWTLGVVAMINCGIALASFPLVIIVGSDDLIRPWCLEDCLAAYEKYQDSLGYYWLDVEYSTGEIQSLPSGPAMVTKALWSRTGGYPKEGSVGAPDHIFISAINASGSRAARLRHVESEKPPYWYRVHEEQMQNTQGQRFGSVIGLVRDVISREWQAREWT